MTNSLGLSYSEELTRIAKETAVTCIAHAMLEVCSALYDTYLRVDS